MCGDGQPVRGWVEGGAGLAEREGDLASPQGSGHILSLSSPPSSPLLSSFLFPLLIPHSSPSSPSLTTHPTAPVSLPSPHLSGVVCPRLKGAKHDGMLELSKPWARAVNKWLLCQLGMVVPGSPFSTTHWSSRPQEPRSSVFHMLLFSFSLLFTSLHSIIRCFFPDPIKIMHHLKRINTRGALLDMLRISNFGKDPEKSV